ncbi:MAG: hypothetical protein SV429_12980, partial [Pseudomonadota bacterium]|nr:hypothetical protein [Pseudomonadota bacterium]
ACSGVRVINLMNDQRCAILIAEQIKYQKVFSKPVPNMKHSQLMLQGETRRAIPGTDFTQFPR